MKTPILKAVAIASVFALSAVTAQAQDQSPPSPEAMEAAMTTAESFAARAASGNQFEIQSSELALQMSQSAETRAFAEQMIADHTLAGEKMMEAAKADNVTVSPALMADHQAQLQALSETAADSFDQAYLGAQVAAHNEAVMLFGGYAERGQPGALQTFAAETLPTLQAHSKELEPVTE